MNQQQLLSIAIEAAAKAGEGIMQIYNTAFEVVQKKDNSPLTAADKKSHEIITHYLSATGIPILSEEGKDIPYSTRKNWEYFWMVDPLDGTKEFVKRNGEFTVNIALLHKKRSIMGVVFIPATQTLYFASQAMGAFKCILNNYTADVKEIFSASEKLTGIRKNNIFTIVASRSHLSLETEKFINEQKANYGEIDFISSGSSIKLCLVAEGLADVYPRFAPTMEWDTAAGQAIVECAGKNVLDHTTGKAMLYNKENLLNNWFIVKA